MKELFLYNHFHNGDIFYSRVLIEHLKTKYKIFYYHSLRTPLFDDMPEIIEINMLNNPSPITNSFVRDKSDFSSNKINTWIGQNKFKYLSAVNAGCSWENYSVLYKDIFSQLDITIEFDSSILPKIYYDKLSLKNKIEEEINKLKRKYKKLIFISNGNVHSGQAPLFDFNPILEILSTQNEDILYLVSQKYQTNRKNIIFTSDITNKIPDLLELGYISTFCDVIVGRASGPYCFSQNEDNLLNKGKKFICFSNTYNEGKYYNDMVSEFVWSNTKDIGEVENILKTNIL